MSAERCSQCKAGKLAKVTRAGSQLFERTHNILCGRVGNWVPAVLVCVGLTGATLVNKGSGHRLASIVPNA